MSPIQEQLKARVEQTQEQILKLIEEKQIPEKLERLTSKTKETIKKHPIQSLLVGLAVGFLVGKLLSGSKEDE